MYSYDRRHIYSYDRRAETLDTETASRLHQLGHLIKTMEERQEVFHPGQTDRFQLLRAGAYIQSVFDVAITIGVRGLFWDILQTYQLDAKDRKVIERANRTFAKRKVNRVAPEKAIAAYGKMLEELRTFFEVASRVVHAKKHTDDASGTILKAGSFQLLNTGGFKDKQMQEASRVVQTAERLLRAKGLGKVCYGDIQVTNTVGRSTRVLAFYVENKDAMFVRANLKGQQGPAVTSVLHELGHRLHHKFLQSNDAKIKDMYRVISGKESKVLMELLYDKTKIPAPGATLRDKKDTWVSEGETVYKGSTKYLKIHLESKPDKTSFIPLAAWFSYSGLTPFISSYAKTSPDENFAEMVAAYCEDRLKEDQVQLLTAVL